MSPRAACLLERYGFSQVYDYVDGKSDWMAYGLPVEGEDGPFVGEQVTDVTTCPLDEEVAGARAALERSGADELVVVAGGLAVGTVDAGGLEGHPDDQPVLDVLHPVPSTVRPSVTVASVAEAGGGQRLVTTSDGRLLGGVVIDAAEPDHGHDHEHGGGDGGSGDVEAELTEVMEAAQERFGDEEPSPDELRSFLRDRLVAEGRTAEDADRILAGMEGETEG